MDKYNIIANKIIDSLLKNKYILTIDRSFIVNDISEIIKRMIKNDTNNIID